MAYPIEKKLVIAVSSSAVFDMDEANSVFVSQGEDAYRRFQRENIDIPFAKGVAFPFVKRLLNLNDRYPKVQPVEVVVLSRNDPDTGQRFFKSCETYELSISRGAFLTGKAPHSYINSFNASLFLSANKADVEAAVAVGLPAGLVLPTEAKDEDSDGELRVAFDFDGVLADDEAEKVFQESNDLELFHQNEVKHAHEPHNPGPLQKLITKISYLQKLEAKNAREIPGYKSALRIAIVTARNAPSHERFVTTLNAWEIRADETFFLGGIEKKRVLDVLKPHIFFDDQLKHLESASKTVPSVHIPFGVTNRPTPILVGAGLPKLAKLQ
jgi:5'-nucleotidase